MPVSWTLENDRKLLLLMLKSVNVSVNLDDVVRLWGPGAPTKKAISLRSALLKKLAREQNAAAFGGGQSATSTPKRAPIAKMRGGLVTPHSSPKNGAKRELDFSDDEVATPRRTKRKATHNVNYDEASSAESEEDGERVKVEYDDFEDEDEYKPESGEDVHEMGVEAEIELKHEAGVAEDVHLGNGGMELLNPAEGMEISGVAEEKEIVDEDLNIAEEAGFEMLEEIEVYRLWEPFKERTPQRELKKPQIGIDWD